MQSDTRLGTVDDVLGPIDEPLVILAKALRADVKRPELRGLIEAALARRKAQQRSE